jgi:hypothetical protein
MSDTLRSLLDEVILAFAALVDAARDPAALQELLADLGWAPLAPPQPLLALAGAGADLVDLIGADEEVSSTRALAAIRRLVEAVNALETQPDAAFPPGLDLAAFKTTIVRDLLDYTLAEYLVRDRHRIGGLLRLAGIIRLIHTPATGVRQAYLQRRIAWQTLGALLTDPARGFREAFEWESTQPRLADALAALASLLESYGLQTSYVQPAGDLLRFVNAGATAPLDALGLNLAFDDALAAPGSFDAGLQLVLRPPTAIRGPAICVLPYARQSSSPVVALSPTTSLAMRGDADFERGVAITLAPGSRPAVETGFLGAAATSAARVELELRVSLPADRPEQVLLGTPQGSRLAVRAAAITGGSIAGPDETELFVALQLEDLHVVLKPDEDSTDAFIASLLGDEGLSAQLSLGLRLSSTTGFHLSGSAGLHAVVPVQARLGPVAFEAVSIGLVPSDQDIQLRVRAIVSTALGPLSVLVDGVGFKLTTRVPDPPTGNLGPLDVALDFLPPSGVGIALDASGIVGTGVLLHDSQQEAYAGVLQLSLQDGLTLTAFGLIATRLPDGTRGYSVLIFITAEGFKPVPLGFGFQLVGIGGMIAVHRTFDQAALTAGLRTDALATLLRPRDPLANAAALLQTLATTFPAQHGSYLLGLLARITWFTPTLVELDLALILELGARRRLLALGRASALLPSRANDLIRLQLNVLGVLDVLAGTLEADAVLVDSRLAHQFPITGSAALRARWPLFGGGVTTGANFVLAVGGLNPRFRVPPGWPALERVTIALCSGSNPRLVCDAYLAVTAGTVQFGARTALYAEALGFSVSGDLSFDALITLLPPHFIVDFHAAVQLKRGTHNLFKVTLDGTLEGPLPLRLAARASFEILWISFSVHFNFTLSAGDIAQAVLAAVALFDEVARALAEAANWSTRRASGLGHGVALRTLPPSGEHQVLDPLGQLVVQQQVAPLNAGRDVDTYVGAPLNGARRFKLAATLNGARGTPVQKGFTPARYFTMTDDEKLAAPSFEVMDAGMVLGAGAFSFDAASSVAAPLTYEAIVLNPPSMAPPPVSSQPPPRYTLPIEALQRYTPSGAAARAPSRREGRARFRNSSAPPAATLGAPEWRIVQAIDGTLRPAQASVRTWSEHRAALATLNRGGARWLMVPTHELEAGQGS